MRGPSENTLYTEREKKKRARNDRVSNAFDSRGHRPNVKSFKAAAREATIIMFVYIN